MDTVDSAGRLAMNSTFLLIGVVLVALPARAGMFGQDFKTCGDQPDTVATITCLDAKTKSWDQRLNAAYGKLAQRIDPAQRDPLVAAQRLWVQFRNANCRFYGSQDGTMRQIQAAECFRAMTEDRTLELEKAMKFD